MHTIDEKYYINVKELMINRLPRPSKKHKISVVINDGEWLPVIDGSTGKVMKI